MYIKYEKKKQKTHIQHIYNFAIIPQLDTGRRRWVGWRWFTCAILALAFLWPPKQNPSHTRIIIEILLFLQLIKGFLLLFVVRFCTHIAPTRSLYPPDVCHSYMHMHTQWIHTATEGKHSAHTRVVSLPPTSHIVRAVSLMSHMTLLKDCVRVWERAAKNK